MSEPSHIPALIDIPRRCGGCGYELTGLPDCGKCPECGGEYDSETIVIFGFSDRGGEMTASGPRLWIILLKQVPYVLLLFILLRIENDWYIKLILLGPLLVGWAFSFWKRWTLMQDSPAPWQVRLSTHGFGERMGIGPVNLRPWRITQQAEVTRVGKGQIRIRVGEPKFSRWPGRGVDVLFDSRSTPEDWAAVIRGLRDRATKPASTPGE